MYIMSLYRNLFSSEISLLLPNIGEKFYVFIETAKNLSNA